MPCIFIPDCPHTMEVVCLPGHQVAPAGADWIEIGPVAGGGWALDGNVPAEPAGVGGYGEYPGLKLAIDAALTLAMRARVRLLYLELDARRCRAA